MDVVVDAGVVVDVDVSSSGKCQIRELRLFFYRKGQSLYDNVIIDLMKKDH